MPVDAATVRSPAAWVVHAAVLVAPAGLLAALAAAAASTLLTAGAAMLGVFALLLLRKVPAWRPPAAGQVILLYLMALGFAWFGTRDAPDLLAHAARGAFLVGAVALTAVND